MQTAAVHGSSCSMRSIDKVLPWSVCSEEMLLDEVARHLMNHIDQLTPQDIAGLVEGFAALDHSPSLVLFDALAARAELIAGDFSPEQRTMVKAGYEQLGYGAKAPAL